MVGVWHCEVGEGVGGPVGCEYGDGELDGGAVGGVCEVRVIRGIGMGVGGDLEGVQRLQ